jgi:hypothetical protein
LKEREIVLLEEILKESKPVFQIFFFVIWLAFLLDENLIWKNQSKQIVNCGKISVLFSFRKEHLKWIIICSHIQFDSSAPECIKLFLANYVKI